MGKKTQRASISSMKISTVICTDTVMWGKDIPSHLSLCTRRTTDAKVGVFESSGTVGSSL